MKSNNRSMEELRTKSDSSDNKENKIGPNVISYYLLDIRRALS